MLAAVDSRGEWERGGGDVSWESSFTVRLGEIVTSKAGGVGSRRAGRPAGWRAGGRAATVGAVPGECAESCSKRKRKRESVCVCVQRRGRLRAVNNV